jgi:ABC-2 type transport system permease protein
MAQHAPHAASVVNAFRSIVAGLLNSRLAALIIKEFRQLRRDPRASFIVILAPMIQLAIFGSVLVATVTSLPLGVVDECNTPESRELVATLTQSGSFRLANYYESADVMGVAINRGQLDAGVVIPHDFARNLWRGQPTTIQFLLNATNANTAEIARGYAEGVLQAYNVELAAEGFKERSSPRVDQASLAQSGIVVLSPAFVFNPGLVGTWFTVTGVLGMLLILNGSILSAMTLIKEREAGTIEQLLMSPASPWDVIIAKITPLFLLLSLMAVFAMAIIRFAFGVPFNGSLALVVTGEILCLLCGIGIGTFVATLASTARQVQLTIFFLNPPLVSLSGAFTPVEAMPRWMQPLTLFNPIRHFGVISRGALIKGSGLETLWPNFLALLGFTVILLSLSVWRYRRQLT